MSRCGEDGVEHHQRSMARASAVRLRNRVRLADRVVQLACVDVVDAGLVVPARVGRRVALGQRVLEEVVHLLAANDAGKRAVLAPKTDARMQHHGHQETRLTLGETQRRDRAHALGEGHPRNSSADAGIRTPAGVPPPAASDAGVDCDSSVKPARTFAAAWRRGSGASSTSTSSTFRSAVRPLVLDADVGKLNVAVDDRKVLTRCPFRHVTRRGSAIALRAAALAIEVAGGTAGSRA